ncbi:hypothetical protein LTR66_008236, partial [Elasticomyces elasticus]
MASESTVDGAASDLTPAQQLMQKHEAEQAHKVTVEDVVDEEDIAHPPPSASTLPSTTQPSGVSTPAEALSAKAAGKQKAVDTPSDTPATGKKADVPLDTKSEESFPALGPAKPSAPAAPASLWGKKPASVVKATNGAVNGNANGLGAPSNTSSRASTPVSGNLTPSITIPSQRGPKAQLNLPGKHSERIHMHPSQLTPRNQLKKPVQDVLRDINKRSKAQVEMKPAGPGGVIVFEGSGPVDAVRQALKDVAKELGSKQSVKVPIPPSVRPYIIGRQGATIQGISKRTGAQIRLPKTEELDAQAEDDDSATIDVLIEGDAVAAEMARREIDAIVNERTSTVNMKLKDIPAEYYPFLVGPQNKGLNALEKGRDLRVQIPQYHRWNEQAPPQALGNGQPTDFAPQAGYPIQIAGDRHAAAEARAEIERQVKQLRQQLTTEQTMVERGRHQFIVGEQGASLQDFLAETGCSIILPPDSEDSEVLTVVGPPDRINAGIEKVIELASSMNMTTVDVARQHANAPLGAQTHARNVSRYLQQRQAIADLERLHDTRIMVPTAVNGPTTWEIYSRDNRNGMRARTDIMNLVNGHPPTRFAPMQVDPFYHEHLRQQAMQQVRDGHGVHLVIPDESDESPEILLVYEGPTAGPDHELPRRQPSPAEVQSFGKALEAAQREIMAMISGQQDIVSREVEADRKFHDKIRRYLDREQAALPSDQIPVQTFVGGPRSQTARKAPMPSVSLRGPSDAVDNLMQNLLAFIEQEKQDELERGFTLTFDFPQKFANFLIGKKGENIKKLREEFDVDIQVNDGKVEIQGPEAKANACKSHIIALGKKLEDETTYVLKVKPQFHRDLIGQGGDTVKRLQDRYNVRINFPRSRQVAEEDATVADADAAPSRRSNQAPDEVIIKGPKRGADEARDEVLTLLQYYMDRSHSATVSVAQ